MGLNFKTRNEIMNRNNKGILKDFCYLFVLLGIAFVSVYFLPQSISRIVFLGFILAFFFSKKDYIWFAFFFILTQGPGYIFADLGPSVHRLPLYRIAPGMSLIPMDIFAIVAIVKAFLGGKRIKMKLRKPLTLLFGYICFASIAGAILFGVNIDIATWHMRWLFYYSFIVSFLYLIYDGRNVYRFHILLTPLAFFILFTQIFFIVKGVEFINLFDPGYRGIAVSETGLLRAIPGGILLLFLCYVFSFVAAENATRLQKVYWYFVIGTCLLSVFISGTRIWVIIFSVILILYGLRHRHGVLNIVKVGTIFAIIVVILFKTGVISPAYLTKGPITRIQQVFGIMQGRIYEAPTFERRVIYEVTPRIDIIKKNPVIGYGISYVSQRYYNNNLGCINTILMFGVFGFLIFVYFFVRYFKLLNSTLKRLHPTNPYRNFIQTMAITWTGILIGYFSTWDFFTFYFRKTFFVSILIATTEILIKEAYNQERL